MKRILSDITYASLLIILLPDAIGSSTTVQNFTGISSHSIALLLFLLLLFFRTQLKTRMSEILIRVNAFVVFPVFFLTSVVLAIADAVMYPNFVFSQTSIQFTQLYSIALFSGAIAVLQMPSAWLEKHYKKIIFYGGLVTFLLAIFANIFPFDQFLHWSQEDEIIEQLQYAVLFMSLIFSFRLCMLFRTKKDLSAFILFAFVLVALLVLFAEEISWGQRIIGIDTPEVFLETNVQNEVSIHNLQIFDRHIDLAYLMVSFLGSIGWVVGKHISFLRRPTISLLIPLNFCTSYFMIALLFYIYNAFDQRFGHFDEFMELMVYTGLMFTLITTYAFVTKRKGIYQQIKKLHQQ